MFSKVLKIISINCTNYELTNIFGSFLITIYLQRDPAISKAKINIYSFNISFLYNKSISVQSHLNLSLHESLNCKVLHSSKLYKI